MKYYIYIHNYIITIYLECVWVSKTNVQRAIEAVTLLFGKSRVANSAIGRKRNLHSLSDQLHLCFRNNLHKRNLVITRDGWVEKIMQGLPCASNARGTWLTPFVPTNGINPQKGICIFLHPRGAGNLLVKSLAGMSTGSCTDARLQKFRVWFNAKMGDGVYRTFVCRV